MSRGLAERHWSISKKNQTYSTTGLFMSEKFMYKYESLQHLGFYESIFKYMAILLSLLICIVALRKIVMHGAKHRMISEISTYRSHLLLVISELRKYLQTLMAFVSIADSKFYLVFSFLSILIQK